MMARKIIRVTAAPPGLSRKPPVRSLGALKRSRRIKTRTRFAGARCITSGSIAINRRDAVVAQIADDEQRVVEATAAYLIARQSADDLPEQIDLDTVAAAYDGYVADLHHQLTPPSNP